MIELVIDKNASEQRLDRFLAKAMPNAKKSLIQKSLRNKNITVNRKKSAANTILKEDDTVQIFFSDETFKKFSANKTKALELSDFDKNLIEDPVFENEDFIVINKPVNMLSQPDGSDEKSLSEIVKNKVSESLTFKTAPLNRLDRNTTGIVIFPKNYQSQKLASESIKERRAKKIYRTIVEGHVSEAGTLIDQYQKDSENNIVNLGVGDTTVSLDYKPVKRFGDFTLLEVELHSGKSHQIRSQLANAGFPILGDPKYGNEKINKKIRDKFNIKSQLLHAYNYILYDKDGNIMLDVSAEEPEYFKLLER